MAVLQRDFTGGSVRGHLIRFGTPFLLSNLVQALYNVGDMWVVGRFAGAEAVSGVHIGGQVTQMLVMAVSSLTVGGTVMVGQYFGAKREDDASRTIGTLFSVLGILALAITALAFLFCDPLLRLLQTPAESFDDARSYLLICMLGNVFVFGYNAVSSVQRGLGDSENPLYFVLLSWALNVLTDIGLVAVLRLGAAGAAWSTIASQGISMMTAMRFLRRNRFLFDFKLRSFSIDPLKLKKLLAIGLPTTMQSLAVGSSFLIMTALVNGFGVDASAAIGVVSKLNGFAILPVIAVQQSISAIAAQNIGAGKHDRALEVLRIGIGFAFLLGVLVFVLVQLLASQMIWLFIDDPGVIASGVSYLRAFSFDYLLVPFVFSFGGLIVASGHTMFSLALALLSSIVLRVPAAWLLSRSLGLFGVGLGAPIATLGSSFLGLWFVLSGRWREGRTGIRAAEAVGIGEAAAGASSK